MMFVCPSVCLCAPQCVCVSLSMSVCPSVCLCVHQYVCVPPSMSVCPSVCLCTPQCVCLSLGMSVCPSVCLCAPQCVCVHSSVRIVCLCVSLSISLCVSCVQTTQYVPQFVYVWCLKEQRHKYFLPLILGLKRLSTLAHMNTEQAKTVPRTFSFLAKISNFKIRNLLVLVVTNYKKTQF